MHPQPQSVAEFTATLTQVTDRIAAAAQRAGRSPADTQLVGVSKTYPISALALAYEAGLRDFGENRTAELEEKAAELGHLPGIRWHAIGRLQRNKAREVASFADEFHALDSQRLAEALHSRLEQANRNLRVYLQVNTSREPQKGGCEPHELSELLTHVQSLPRLAVAGFMTMAAAGATETTTRQSFSLLRDLRDKHLPHGGLSMGMSNDFEWAIEEGATVVRIGSSIFGTRDAKAPA